MALTRTRTELVQEALQILVPLATNDHSAEDVTFVDRKVDPVLRRLNAEGTTYIADSNAIPLEEFTYIAIILASAATENFATALTTVNAGEAELSLRKLHARAPSFAVLEACYY